MSAKIVYFVHGTTTDNEQEISSGWKDVALSALGIKQSEELLPLEILLKSLIPNWSQQAMRYPTQLGIKEDPRLRECIARDGNNLPAFSIPRIEQQTKMVKWKDLLL